tara:strand:+ start:4164 stop:4880 length:717 start_codon:yes stop_codon:yes gene_type:complete
MNKILENINSFNDRFELWKTFIHETGVSTIAEIGVYKGDFAQEVLESCQGIEKYYMIDPWKNLSDWNKPANMDNNTFEAYYLETIKKTDFAKKKRKVLRGKTTEVINEIENESLDFIYIDGDHTLKGISIDLINAWPKLKPEGFLAGDDFCPSIWQHSKKYEPTMVFPYAVYFAEAVGATIYGLPHDQFLIEKESKEFKFIDLTESSKYKNVELRNQLVILKSKKQKSIFQKLKRKIR